MAAEDYYRLLGISPQADSQQIKKAYRQLALRYHPDKNPDNPAAADKFKAITLAYGVLIRPEKRAAYDRQRRPSPYQPAEGDIFRASYEQDTSPESIWFSAGVLLMGMGIVGIGMLVALLLVWEAF